MKCSKSVKRMYSASASTVSAGSAKSLRFARGDQRRGRDRALEMDVQLDLRIGRRRHGPGTPQRLYVLPQIPASDSTCTVGASPAPAGAFSSIAAQETSL